MFSKYRTVHKVSIVLVREQKVMSPGAKAVTRGLFLMVVSSQDMKRVAGSYIPFKIHKDVLLQICLPTPQLQEVARATTVASLMYASPSWWGFTSAGDQERMERLINKLKRCGFLPMSASNLANEADQRLFRSVIHNPNRVLHKLLPDVRRVSYNLRPRVDGFELPIKDDRNFISRLLYNDIY